MKKIILFLTFILGLSLANISFANELSSYNYWRFWDYNLSSTKELYVKSWNDYTKPYWTDKVKRIYELNYWWLLILFENWNLVPVNLNNVSSWLYREVINSLISYSGLTWYDDIIFNNTWICSLKSNVFKCFIYSFLPGSWYINYSYTPNFSYKSVTITSFWLAFIKDNWDFYVYDYFNWTKWNFSNILIWKYKKLINWNLSWNNVCWILESWYVECFRYSADYGEFPSYYHTYISDVVGMGTVVNMSWSYVLPQTIINFATWWVVSWFSYDGFNDSQSFVRYFYYNDKRYIYNSLFNSISLDVFPLSIDLKLSNFSLSYQKCENKLFAFEYPYPYFQSNGFASWNLLSERLQIPGFYYQTQEWAILEINELLSIWTGDEFDYYHNIDDLLTWNLVFKTSGSWTNLSKYKYDQWFNLWSIAWDVEYVKLDVTWDVSYYYIADANWNRLFPSENWGKGRQFLSNTFYKLKWYWLWNSVKILFETWRFSKTYTLKHLEFWGYQTQYDDQDNKYCVTYFPEDNSYITYDISTQKYIYDDWDIKWEVKYNPDTNKFDVVDDNWDIQKSIPSTKKQTIDWVDFTQEQVDKATWQDNVNRANEIKQEETKVAWCSTDDASPNITLSNFFSQDFWKIVRNFLYCKMDVDSWITYLKINVPPKPDLDFNFVWPKVTFNWWYYFLWLEKVSWKFTAITDKSWILSIDTTPTSWSYLLTFFIFIIYVLFRFTIIFLLFIVYPLFDYISKKISIFLFTWESAVFDPWNLASMFVYVPVLLFRFGVLIPIFAILVIHLLDVGNYSIDFFNAFLWFFLSSLWTYSFFSNLFNLFISWIIWYSTLYLIYLLVKKFGRFN